MLGAAPGLKLIGEVVASTSTIPYCAYGCSRVVPKTPKLFDNMTSAPPNQRSISRSPRRCVPHARRAMSGPAIPSTIAQRSWPLSATICEPIIIDAAVPISTDPPSPLRSAMVGINRACGTGAEPAVPSDGHSAGARRG